MARRTVRVGLGMVGAIAAVLLLMPFSAATPLGGTPAAKAGALHEAGRAMAYVPYKDPSVTGTFLGTITPPTGASAAPLAAPTPPAAAPVPAAKHPTSPQPIAEVTGLNETKAPVIFGDPSIGVSASYLVEVAGDWARIESPTGKTVYSTFSLASFFNISKTDSLYYGHVVYDSLSKRWLISTMDVTTDTDYASISKTSSPRGAFYAYTARVMFGSGANEFMDYAQWGVSATYWGFSADVWNATSNSFIGNIVGLFGKVKLDGGTFLPQAFGSLDLSVTPEVAISNNGTGTPTFYAASTGVYAASTTLTVWEYTGIVPHASATEVQYTINSTGDLPGIPEPGTSAYIETFSERVMSASWSSGGSTLWVTYVTACLPTGDSTTRTCVRADAVDTTVNLLSQDQNIGIAGSYLYAPSLTAMANGTGFLMEFGYSGALTYPSLAITGQATTDSFNTYRGPIPVSSGTTYDTYGYGEASTDTQFGSTPQGTAWSAGCLGSASGWQSETVHYRF